MSKKRVVLYLNQFYGSIGGEDKADIGFMVKEELVGPGSLFQQYLGDDYEIAATLICGDDYFSKDPDANAKVGLEKIKGYKPDIFFAGPAFAAGRYSVACGVMCKEVQEELNIPAITGMNEDTPGVDLYRSDAYIVKTEDNARNLKDVVKKMVSLGEYLLNPDEKSNLLTLENLPDPDKYNYFTRGQLRNVYVENTVAERSVELLLKRLKGEPFESEIIPDRFEDFEIPKGVKDLAKARIAFVTDGGLVPKGNPDNCQTRSNLVWGEYNLDEVFEDYEVVHAGYFNDYVLEDPNRLIPYDILKEMVDKGEVGEVIEVFYSNPACTTVSAQCEKNGGEIAQTMLDRGDVDAVILTST